MMYPIFIGFLTITTFKIVKLSEISSVALFFCVCVIFFVWLMENKIGKIENRNYLRVNETRHNIKLI